MRVFGFLAVLLCAGCASYITPGGAARLDELAPVTAGLATRQPLPHFPAVLAVARVQASDYRSFTSEAYGDGRFSILTNGELLNADQIGVLSKWPSVASVTTFTGVPLPEHFESLDDLRLAAAKLQADVMLIYTVDTSFDIQGQAYGPSTAVSLKIAPDGKASIDSKASAVFMDVRTGFIYGNASASDQTADLASAWTSKDAVDKKRLATEQQAFSGLVAEAGKTWAGIVNRYQ